MLWHGREREREKGWVPKGFTTYIKQHTFMSVDFFRGRSEHVYLQNIYIMWVFLLYVSVFLLYVCQYSYCTCVSILTVRVSVFLLYVCQYSSSTSVRQLNWWIRLESRVVWDCGTTSCLPNLHIMAESLHGMYYSTCTLKGIKVEMMCKWQVDCLFVLYIK